MYIYNNLPPIPENNRPEIVFGMESRIRNRSYRSRIQTFHFKKDLDFWISDFNFHSDDYLQSHVLRNGLCLV